jgi:NADH-quinone oxidoreductase subunit N
VNFVAPHIDYAGISPIIALSAGICVVLLAGVFRASRWTLAGLALATLAAAAGLAIWQWGEHENLVSGALRLDEFALAAVLIATFAASVVVLISIREPAAERSGFGEYYTLLLGSVLGMLILAEAQNLVSFFLGLELLSVPLYVLCASEVRREGSLESGLKYLVIGSLGSATLLYGLALIYGGGRSTDFNAIAIALGNGASADSLVLIGTAMVATGLAFKISLAPFHQWTPDVYQGAPTPVTGFMAVATKAAAFVALVRLFEVPLGPLSDDWKPALAALAVVSMLVGNIGALGQDSLKRLLGYSGIAQAGYMLVGVVVADETGRNALVFYLAAYCLMNLAVFCVIVARERETDRGDDISAVEGIGRTRPLLAWPLTIGMLALAGLPGTAGFMGKLYLIEAAVEGDYTWLGVAIVVGTMVSLAYYLRVVAAVWMKPEPAAAPTAMPAIAGAAPGAGDDADAPWQPKSTTNPGEPKRVEAAGSVTGARRPGTGHCPLISGPALLCAAATVVFGIAPSPLIDWAANAGASLATFL